MKQLTYLFSLLLAALLLAACSDSDDIIAEGADPQELTALDAHMSRATTVAALREYVGRHQFADGDVAVFTTFKRSMKPIGLYTYHDIEFSCTATTDSKGNTSIGWSRIKNKGTTEEGNNEKYPDRIYWTDAENAHTFIGYCLPQQGGGAPEFDWKHTEGTAAEPAVYYGSIGDPAASGDIDFSTTGTAPDTVSGNQELRRNDILLTYSDCVKAADAIAKLNFYHGLAQVRVIVNISDFAAGGGDDTRSRVSNMKLHDMLMLYKWKQTTPGTQYLLPDDQTTLNTLYSSAPPAYNQRKDVKLWNPNADGIGENSSRTFTYYGLAVPTQISAGEPQRFSFDVTYPSPMNPEVMVTKEYSGSIGNIHFDAGKCTTINISLNHRNEKMTIGAEYDDWDFIDTPDQGALKKHSTFLDTADRDSVTIASDPKATVDDATWLYLVDRADNNSLRDIYGNDGSMAKPFIISTARELLSFAYEVKSGRTFAGLYVKLDADITMQPTSKVMHDSSGFYTGSGESKKTARGVVWPSIGDAMHPFCGNFQGGSRYINLLYGKALFAKIGRNGFVEHFFINRALGVTGKGSFTEVNDGIICGCYIEGGIKVEDTSADYCGSIAGLNNAVLIACSHIGDTEGYGTVGALVGKNDGILVSCYCVGDAKTNTAGKGAYAGVGEYTDRSFAYSCYFDTNKYTGQDYSDLSALGTIGHVAFPLTTALMQSNKFVDKPFEEVLAEGMPTGEITAEGYKTNELYYHWSLNAGLRRSITYFKQEASAATGDNVSLVAPQKADGSSVEPLALPRSYIQWLADHFDYDTAGAVRYEYKYYPATYPKLQVLVNPAR